MRSILVSALLVLFLLPALGTTGVREDFEQAAVALSFFSWGDFLYRRELTPRVPGDEAHKYNETLAHLIDSGLAGTTGRPILRASRRASPEEVSALLRHENPKVRTLAMAWLFANKGQSALPQLVGLVGDTAETFPVLQSVASMYLPAQNPPLKTQTVSDIARGMLAFYMERAGYYYGVEGKNEHPGFYEYWERRGERVFCLSWFAVKLDRATGGISPLAYGAELRAHQVRRQVDELPPVDREVVLLGLFAAKTDLRDVVSEQDLVFAGRRLGAERLLQLLRGESVIDDPDLPHYRDRIRDLVLQHSAELLRPADGPWLIEQGRTTRKADWFRAAADLRPESASVILREAFQACDFLGDGRTRAATALWRLAGQENEDFLVEWFFGDEAPNVGRAPYRAGFMDFLTERFQVIDRCLLARFVRDTRFEQLDWQTLESLMNGYERRSNNRPGSAA